MSPDVFSVMALESLSRVLPKWMSWGKSAAKLETLSTADYVFPEPNLKILGIIVQRYRLKSGKPTEAFREYIDDLDRSMDTILEPALRKANMLASNTSQYDSNNDLRIANIPDFNTLIANSQKAKKPVFALTQQDTNRQGKVWVTQKASIDSFKDNFRQLADKIILLTS